MRVEASAVAEMVKPTLWPVESGTKRVVLVNGGERVAALDTGAEGSGAAVNE